MNKTVELVTEWAKFADAHPEASVEEFCRHYLTLQRSNREPVPNFKGSGVPPHSGGYLMKLLGYIVRAFETYMSQAFTDIPEIKQAEDFYFLNNIAHRGECRKTEVTNMQLLGVSSGIDVLNRLLANGLIGERVDDVDKRAKLVKLTEKGREVLHKCYRQAGKVSDIVLCDITEEDIRLCIQLLRVVESKHSTLVFEMRDKPLDEIYEKIVGHAPVYEEFQNRDMRAGS